MKQNGYVFRAGNWWYLRYRDNILEHGSITRKQLTHKLDSVTPEHRRLKRPPQSVLDAATEFLRPLNQNRLSPESNQTLVDFVENVYFPYAQAHKRVSTLRTDRNRWKRHLRAYCEGTRLREFRTVTGERLIAEIARRNDLSRATLRQIKSFLSAVFKHAKRLGFLDGVNPMQDVSIPRTRDSGDTYAYSHDEVKKMLTVLAEPAKSIVAVAAYSGLRRGEIQGLRWEDYDGSYLHVARSVWEGFISEPKTKSSKASVPVIQTLSRYLDTWRFIRQSPSSGVMFVTTRGTPMRLNNVLRGQMLPAFASAGLEWHGWHGFRRGLATNLHLEGVDDLTIKNILRHSDVAVTQRSYIKPVSKKSVDAMTKLDERVSKLNEPSEPVVQ